MTFFETISGRSRSYAAQIRLVLAGCALTVAMMFIVPLVSATIPFPYSYACLLGTYWIVYCIPVSLGCGGNHPRVTVKFAGTRWQIVVAALAMPILVAIGAGTVNVGLGHPELIVLAIAVGLINGPLEEFAWRRPYRSNGRGRLRFESLGLLIFTCWHVPLLLVSGATYDFGASGLLGGSFLMGLIWLLMTRATNSIAWPAVSHALVNIVAFIPLFQPALI
ncbi:CPBP family glutamic-type intramembrane protease [Phaeobacter inhibens]|uniref:CPBP family glutamic-type intramembrane protease n=1 Tax=Phaeobacter inhibens TaxID=221822 RepID=UPI0021A73E27|nr:CPBP family glutamic-type intramembrane protease [Phaeobacter inhibens]UWR47029.1 CPBP family intramembrane metalloprotease [Phaeobacter inhibens]UWR90485.1 CPBP family intramembrane metalloprotease [Phaeobacter inhibens]